MYLSTYYEFALSFIFRNVKVNLLFVCLNVKNALLISFGISGLLPENKQLISNYDHTPTQQENRTTLSNQYKHILKVALISFLFCCLLNCIFDLMHLYKIVVFVIKRLLACFGNVFISLPLTIKSYDTIFITNLNINNDTNT